MITCVPEMNTHESRRSREHIYIKVINSEITELFQSDDMPFRIAIRNGNRRGRSDSFSISLYGYGSRGAKPRYVLEKDLLIIWSRTRYHCGRHISPHTAICQCGRKSVETIKICTCCGCIIIDRIAPGKRAAGFYDLSKGIIRRICICATVG